MKNDWNRSTSNWQLAFPRQVKTPIKARPCYYQLAPLDWSLEGKRLLSSFGSHLRWALSSGNVTIYSRGRGGWSSLHNFSDFVCWLHYTGNGFNRTCEQMYRFSILLQTNLLCSVRRCFSVEILIRISNLIMIDHRLNNKINSNCVDYLL